ncbi:MAG: DNA topoisomerase IB [Alphaproteobacteria bacterium]|jgi:DNA topoisomerase I|nr:DNA topoisomerase IB [Alphaproteobacteria bacterium]MBU2041763.1 DNA topoisomerase IB [Alphaproteobacteria bacterium]MBU2126934.1 DNA topoisomerase IB [Alphaproteobacteria bacterium]MBU2208376.1 DNA topoisomerase IB [Alphaproteobacteria bacterium]MBU2290995.1 DNA topoisomerase IB [Alphaproteobacteria bacterium]
MAHGALDVPARAEVPTGLTWCSDEHPGLRRTPAGKGFAYHDAKGELIRDAKRLDRIRALGIPPAWTDVWICPRATGHIQATGRDMKGRKQYRYHEDWSRHASESKFERLPEFARALPRLRKRVETDLNRRGVSREKVLATAVRLLEITLIRVGNAQYAKQNRSYGLTTLNKRHLDLTGTALTFAFKGKSGVEHEVRVRDRRLATVIRSLRDLPGQQLFKYRDPDGDLCAITSDDVNAYIREAMGDAFSAKDFRTWAGTVSAARALREAEPPASPADARRRITVCVKAVAGLLGNTPTVCRSSYVHPAVFELYESGRLGEVLPGPGAAGFERALARTLTA